jgi:hypothetical protein
VIRLGDRDDPTSIGRHEVTLLFGQLGQPRDRLFDVRVARPLAPRALTKVQGFQPDVVRLAVLHQETVLPQCRQVLVRGALCHIELLDHVTKTHPIPFGDEI